MLKLFFIIDFKKSDSFFMLNKLFQIPVNLQTNYM